MKLIFTIHTYSTSHYTGCLLANDAARTSPNIQLLQPAGLLPADM